MNLTHKSRIANVVTSLERLASDRPAAILKQLDGTIKSINESSSSVETADYHSYMKSSRISYEKAKTSLQEAQSKVKDARDIIKKLIADGYIT